MDTEAAKTGSAALTRRQVIGGALAAMAVAATVPLAGTASAADSRTGSWAFFTGLPSSYRPRWRWWWGEPYEVGSMVEELRAMKAAGFSGAEIAYFGDVLKFATATTTGQGSVTGWGTAEQRAQLGAALREAADADFEIDQTLGFGWPVRTPSTNGLTEHCQREVIYGRTDLTGAVPYAGPVPMPLDDASNSQRASLVAVTAARVVERGPAVTAAGTPPKTSTVLDEGSLIDLTTQATGIGSPAGVVSWTPPEGEWILFGWWSRVADHGLLADAITAAPVDYFSIAASEAALRDIEEMQLGPENAELVEAANRFFFEDSLENKWFELPWTGDMLQTFSKRRGYALTKFLPLLMVQSKYHYWVPAAPVTPDFTVASGADDRVRHDFDTLLTELYVERHVRPFHQWARRRGSAFRAQVGFGLAFDVTRSARELVTMGGVAEEESLNAGDSAPLTIDQPNWRFAMDHFRATVSGVHQAGGTLVTIELGAHIAGNVKMMFLEYYQQLMDKQWAAGVTRPILHGLAYSPAGTAWPGKDVWLDNVSESWNHRTFPEWRNMDRLAAYWTRGAALLESGQALCDVAVYRDGFVTTQAGPPPGTAEPFFPTRDLERAGYRHQYLDPAGLLDSRALGNDCLYPSGPRYRALVIDEGGVPGPVATRIATAVRRGLKVVIVGAAPQAGRSNRNATAEDAVVRNAFATLRGSPRVRQVKDWAEVPTALRRLGVHPSVELDRPADIYSQSRRTNTHQHFYLYNAGSRSASRHVSFEAAGAPFLLDPWTGRVTEVRRFVRRGGRTVVTLDLPSRSGVFVSFDRAVAARRHVVATTAHDVVTGMRGGLVLVDPRRSAHTVVARTDDGRQHRHRLGALPRPIELPSWTLDVTASTPDGPQRSTHRLQRLTDWRQIDGLQSASGVGTYTTTVQVAPGWLTGQRGVRLALGTRHGSVVVKVNGQTVPSDLHPARPLDVTRYLRPGRNTLVVTLATTLANQYTASNGGPNTQPQPYGLLGPVRLVPEHRITI